MPESECGCDALDAILKLREICHLPRPRKEDLNVSIDRSFNESILSTEKQGKPAVKRGGRGGRKRTKMQPNALLEKQLSQSR